MDCQNQILLKQAFLQYIMPETNRIEYKREIHTDVDIEKEVISFLSYHEGGVIYMGIGKNGKVVGIDDADGARSKSKTASKTIYRLRPWACLT